MNIYWYYYRSLLLASIAISFLFSVISLQLTLSSVSLDMDNFGLKKFVILYATVGFSLAALLDTFFYKNKKYIFYNMGYSRRSVFFRVSIFNWLIMILLCLLM